MANNHHKNQTWRSLKGPGVIVLYGEDILLGFYFVTKPFQHILYVDDKGKTVKRFNRE